MRPPKIYWDWWGIVLAVVFIVAFLLSWHPEIIPPPRPHRIAKPLPFTVSAENGSEIFTWDAHTKTLTVSAHAPRDLLLCLGDPNNCDLVEGWRTRVGVTGR